MATVLAVTGNASAFDADEATAFFVMPHIFDPIRRGPDPSWHVRSPNRTESINLSRLCNR
jgi:hypothetical protein